MEIRFEVSLSILLSDIFDSVRIISAPSIGALLFLLKTEPNMTDGSSKYSDICIGYPLSLKRGSPRRLRNIYERFSYFPP